MDKVKKPVKLPPFLLEIRDQLVADLDKKGISLQNISDIFSSCPSKARVHQIVNGNGSK